MVNPITNLQALAYSLGSELNLSWKLPPEMPLLHSIVLIKKPENDISKEELDNYFQKWQEIEELKNSNVSEDDITQKTNLLSSYLDENKLLVRRFINDTSYFTDLQCSDGIEYFYKIFIQDLSDYELSLPASVSAIPQMTAKSEVFDAKNLTVKGIKRVLDSLKKLKEPYRMEIDVFKEFHEIEGVDQWIVVHRASSDIVQRFLGDVLWGWNDHIVSGFIENEVIQVTWYSKNNQERLDSLNKIFRSQTQAFKRLMLHAGATEALVSFIPDGMAEHSEGQGIMLYSGMLISVLSENQTTRELDADMINIPEIFPCHDDSIMMTPQ